MPGGARSGEAAREGAPRSGRGRFRSRRHRPFPRRAPRARTASAACRPQQVGFEQALSAAAVHQPFRADRPGRVKEHRGTGRARHLPSSRAPATPRTAGPATPCSRTSLRYPRIAVASEDHVDRGRSGARHRAQHPAAARTVNNHVTERKNTKRLPPVMRPAHRFCSVGTVQAWVAATTGAIRARRRDGTERQRRPERCARRAPDLAAPARPRCPAGTSTTDPQQRSRDEQRLPRVRPFYVVRRIGRAAQVGAQRREFARARASLDRRVSVRARDGERHGARRSTRTSAQCAEPPGSAADRTVPGDEPDRPRARARPMQPRSRSRRAADSTPYASA